MRLDHNHIPLRILITIAICISLLITSCKHKPGTTAEALKCEQFFDSLQVRLKAGILIGDKTYKRITDSFYNNGKLTDAFCLMKVYAVKSRYYYTFQSYDSSLIYADSLLAIFDKDGNRKKFMLEYINALNLKGEILYGTNHYNQAYSCYFKAREASQQLNDPCARNAYNYGMAMISYKQKKYDLAIAYFRLSYSYTAQCTSYFNFSLQQLLDDIALCYEKMNKLDSALYYYDSTLSFIKQNSNAAAIYASMANAVVYGNMGGVFLLQGKTDTAIALLKKSIAINMQPLFDHNDALLTHIKLANAYLKKNDLPLLAGTLTGIRKELDTISHTLTAEADWRQLMYQYYEKTGNTAEAFKFYKDFAALRDSLWLADKDQLQNDLDRELKERDQSYQIGLLQKQNQVNNLYLEITIGLSILAGIIIILIYVNYKRSKKNVIALTLLNTQIEEQKKQLERTTNDKDRILHIVAHDLRNPIGAAMMLSNSMLEDEDDESNKESLEMIVKASKNSLALIGELLEFSGAEKQEKNMFRETFDITESVNYARSLLQFKADEKKQTLDFSYSGRPLYVSANKERMNRVFGNVIANAIKFSPLNSAIYILVSERNDHVIIEIKDSGIGIPANMLPVIFNTFTTAKRYGTSGETSFGLGLSICKQIIEANGGRIWAESTEGKGSSFFIELPLV